MKINPDPKTYIDVIIHDRQFLIVECEKKPDGVSAHSTLERIASVMREGLEYANVNDRFSLLSKDERYKELKKIAQEIRAGYMEKSAGLLDITRFFARVEKKEKDLKAHFKYIKNFAELHSILNQPNVEHAFRQLSVREMRKLAVNEIGESLVYKGIIERAHEFGYRGTNFEEAKNYLRALFQTVSDFVKSGRLPEEYVVYRNLGELERYVDPEATLVNIKELTRENKDGLKAKFSQWLLRYAKFGDLEICNVLIQLGADVNAKRYLNDEVTPLTLAIMRSHEDVAKRLIEAGADTNAKDVYGRTPLMFAPLALAQLLLENGAKETIDHRYQGNAVLHLAVQKGYRKFVDLLINAGANLEIRGAEGTPLELAAKNGHKNIVERLIRAGADVNTTNDSRQIPLILAIQRSKSLKIPQLLLENGGKATIDHVDYNGNTALYLAVKKGDVDLVDILLKSGANLEIKDKVGNTPLAFASMKGYKDVVEKLIDAGADIKVQNSVGETPLMLSSGHETFQLLFNKGGKDTLNYVDKLGDTVLHKVARYNILSAVDLLLKSGAALEMKNYDGLTPLALAAKIKSKAMVDRLIGAGANSYVKDKQGRTPLMLAIIGTKYSNLSKKTLIQFVRDFEAQINFADRSGFTALHYAVQENSADLVEYLVKFGANLEAKNNSGLTPLALAAEKGYEYESVAKKLIQLGSDTNTQDKAGRTPLMHAVYSKSSAIARLLLEKGGKATINHADNVGDTALHLTMRTRYCSAQDYPVGLIKLLVDFKAELKPNAEGKTPYELADGQPDIQKLLPMKMKKTNFDHWKKDLEI